MINFCTLRRSSRHGHFSIESLCCRGVVQLCRTTFEAKACTEFNFSLYYAITYSVLWFSLRWLSWKASWSVRRSVTDLYDVAMWTKTIPIDLGDLLWTTWINWIFLTSKYKIIPNVESDKKSLVSSEKAPHIMSVIRQAALQAEIARLLLCLVKGTQSSLLLNLYWRDSRMWTSNSNFDKSAWMDRLVSCPVFGLLLYEVEVAEVVSAVQNAQVINPAMFQDKES